MTMIRTLLLGTAAAAALAAAPAQAARYKHVLLISVDGLHAGDVAHFTTGAGAAPGSTLALLAAHGTTYNNALTTGPSDSFPGMISLATGGSPRSAGVYYDDSYDRTLFAPGSDCQGPAGAEIVLDNSVDYNNDDVTAGGTLGKPLTQINPANLPMTNASGTCKPLYPHQFIRVNTVFEVIRAAGKRTAWADKHPAYDILNGPSGRGIDDLFTPEVDVAVPGTRLTSTTGSYTAIRGNDELKVQAVLNEIRGLDSTGTQKVGVPAILGMNFQAVSVGQKLAVSGPTDPAGLAGGYTDADYTPGSALSIQFAYVDAALGRMIAALNDEGLINDTLVIVTAKHGQSPVDVRVRQGLSNAPYDATPGVAHTTTDDVAFVWLTPQTRAANVAAAETYLRSQAATLQIDTLLNPASVAQIFRNPAKDSRAPDFVAITKPGVIYTGGTKLAEHGGFAFQDRNVGMVVAATNLAPATYEDTVYTTQVAPTILRALGLEPSALKAVGIEKTKILPGLLSAK